MHKPSAELALPLAWITSGREARLPHIMHRAAADTVRAYRAHRLHVFAEGTARCAAPSCAAPTAPLSLCWQGGACRRGDCLRDPRRKAVQGVKKIDPDPSPRCLLAPPRALTLMCGRGPDGQRIPLVGAGRCHPSIVARRRIAPCRIEVRLLAPTGSGYVPISFRCQPRLHD